MNYPIVKKIKKIGNSKKIKLIAKQFLKSEPEFRCCELFAKPKKNGLPLQIIKTIIIGL